MTYDLTAFVTLERQPLDGAATVRGTHYLVADGHGGGHMFTEEQQAELTKRLLPAEMNRDRRDGPVPPVQAVNTAAVPRYACFKAAWPSADRSLRLRARRSRHLAVYESGLRVRGLR